MVLKKTLTSILTAGMLLAGTNSNGLEASYKQEDSRNQDKTTLTRWHEWEFKDENIDPSKDSVNMTRIVKEIGISPELYRLEDQSITLNKGMYEWGSYNEGGLEVFARENEINFEDDKPEIGIILDGSWTWSSRMMKTEYALGTFLKKEEIRVAKGTLYVIADDEFLKLGKPQIYWELEKTPRPMKVTSREITSRYHNGENINFQPFLRKGLNIAKFEYGGKATLPGDFDKDVAINVFSEEHKKTLVFFSLRDYLNKAKEKDKFYKKE